MAPPGRLRQKIGNAWERYQNNRFLKREAKASAQYRKWMHAQGPTSKAYRHYYKADIRQNSGGMKTLVRSAMSAKFAASPVAKAMRKEARTVKVRKRAVIKAQATRQKNLRALQRGKRAGSGGGSRSGGSGGKSKSRSGASRSDH